MTFSFKMSFKQLLLVKSLGISFYNEKHIISSFDYGIELSGSQPPTKPRRLTGRKEEMAVHYAIGPQEDDSVIKQRLMTRTTTTRGEPPLRKLHKKFVLFATEIDKDIDNYAECERLSRSFLQEITTFELPLLKTAAVIDANKREKDNFNVLQEELNQQILQAQSDIEDLKQQLEESKIERQHKEECEAIRRLISAQPPRHETQKTLSELEREIAVLEAENTAASRTLDLRKKQFSLLLHVVDELQNTMDEEQRNMAEELRNAMEEQRNPLEGSSLTTDFEPGTAIAVSEQAEAMHID